MGETYFKPIFSDRCSDRIDENGMKTVHPPALNVTELGCSDRIVENGMKTWEKRISSLFFLIDAVTG